MIADAQRHVAVSRYAPASSHRLPRKLVVRRMISQTLHLTMPIAVFVGSSERG
jgi:hypothetical protein